MARDGQLRRLIELAYKTEMANIMPKDSGLPAKIFISHRDSSHSARIKVFDKKLGRANSASNLVTIVISTLEVVGKFEHLTKKDVDIICSWIVENRKLLLKYWNDSTMTSDEFKSKMKKV